MSTIRWPSTVEEMERQIEAARNRYYQPVSKLSPCELLGLIEVGTDRLHMIEAELTGEEKRQIRAHRVRIGNR